jgi:hypothetical protein
MNQYFISIFLYVFTKKIYKYNFFKYINILIEVHLLQHFSQTQLYLNLIICQTSRTLGLVSARSNLKDCDDICRATCMSVLKKKKVKEKQWKERENREERKEFLTERLRYWELRKLGK